MQVEASAGGVSSRLSMGGMVMNGAAERRVDGNSGRTGRPVGNSLSLPFRMLPMSAV
ncbi:hypothetical protein ABEX25_25570 [Paenibacillus thiaminolyticus]|uniref:hypothetical protein n=1 Tax=Paenibacillus thiaminolyticus TaxID=49283 RepID=UPI003D294906